MKTTHAIVPDAAVRTIDSPVGPLVLAAVDRGLTHVLYAACGTTPPDRDGSPEAAGILAAVGLQLREYFDGGRERFDLPLAPRGTAFQISVWRQLVRVAYGETVSYGEIAARLGKPRSVRAVGAANGANPISIIVPCHRVIGAGGRLTGYAGGLDAKRRLLALEAASRHLQGHHIGRGDDGLLATVIAG